MSSFPFYVILLCLDSGGPFIKVPVQSRCRSWSSTFRWSLGPAAGHYTREEGQTPPEQFLGRDRVSFPNRIYPGKVGRVGVLRSPIFDTGIWSVGGGGVPLFWESGSGLRWSGGGGRTVGTSVVTDTTGDPHGVSKGARMEETRLTRDRTNVDETTVEVSLISLRSSFSPLRRPPKGH